MTITRRKALLSACALAGTSALPLNAEAQPTAPASQTPEEAVSLADYELLARERISHMAYEYISGGAGDNLLCVQAGQNPVGDIRKTDSMAIA